MATNEILPFAQAGGANVLSQSEYEADPQRIIGNQPGIARSNFVNKAALQASAMAAGLGQFLADNQSTDVTDQKTPAELSAMMVSAVTSLGASLSNDPPLMNGVSAPGVGTLASRFDHVHPTDTTRAPLESPAFTGVPTAPTAAPGTNTTQIATTAFVASAALPAATTSQMQAGTLNTVSGTPANIRAHLSAAKIWINYDATTNTVTSNYNVSSLVDNGVGDHTINFSLPMNGTAYTYIAHCEETTLVSGTAGFLVATRATNSIRIRTGYNSATPNRDCPYVSVGIFGAIP